ncbi:MAG: hypothetical protein LW823_05665 [Rickettsiales bacterium]|nr:hypothetical protein [Rickettsiales bacterium]
MEISIVLVVIGLVIGGILVGKDLIKAAEIRRIITQLDQFNVAVNVFKNKYNCLPGDCLKASDSGLTEPSPPEFALNGDGNSMIQNLESRIFWLHLSKAGLIAFIPREVTVNKACEVGVFPVTPCLGGLYQRGAAFKGGWWIIHPYDEYGATNYTLGTLAYSHFWWLTARFGGGSDASATIPPEDAYAIDVKIDDGFPMSGIALATGDNNGDPYGFTDPLTGNVGANVNVCVADNTQPYRYNILNISRHEMSLCSMVIRTIF